jgi:hypothetical protein
METQPKYTKAEIEEAFHVECPYFYDLQTEVQAVKNGIVTLHVRKYKGKVQEWITTVSKRKVVN